MSEQPNPVSSEDRNAQGEAASAGEREQAGPRRPRPQRPHENLFRFGAGGGGIEGCTAAAFGFPLKRWHTAVVVLLVAGADVCLYSHPGGTGAAVLFLVASIGLLSIAPDRGRGGIRPLDKLGAVSLSNRASPGLMLTLFLVAAALAWNAGPLLHFVGWCALIAFAIKLHRPDWTITELLWAAPWTAALAPLRLFGHLLHWFGYAAKKGSDRVEPKRRLRLRVVLVPLAVVVVFILIFMAANPVVERLVNDALDRVCKWLEDFRDLFAIERMFTWLLWLTVFAALVRPLAKSWLADLLANRPEDMAAPSGPAEQDGDNYAAALATLAAVNLLFLAFNALDSVYLYFKAALPEGISFSEYSHRGCFWLTVALLLSTGVIGAVFKGRLGFHPRTGLLRTLSYVWAAQNVILAVGALRRLQLYIDYNGLTRMRIVGLYGILLVVVGLVLMVVKVCRAKNFLWIVRRDLLAFSIALVVLALTPLDYLSWTYNAAAATAGNLRPLANLNVQKMSPESYPPLIPLLDHDEKWVREGIAALLARKYDELWMTKPTHWTEWQGAHTWALARLRVVRPKLDAVAPTEARAAAERKLLDRVAPFLHTRSDDVRLDWGD